jgi:hypothetical protein
MLPILIIPDVSSEPEDDTPLEEARRRRNLLRRCVFGRHPGRHAGRIELRRAR